MYSAGKDGDLRDIWRRVTGEIPLEKGAKSSGTAHIMTVFGKEGVVEHTVDDVTKEIAVVGKHLQDRGAKRVAVYLPNSLEFLCTLFAGAFYGFTPILIPYNQPHQTLIELLAQTGADTLIAEAGSVPLADVSQAVSGLRSIVWTVEKTSRHMDWSEVPEGIGGKVDVAVWHELVQEHKNGAASLPSTSEKPPGVVFLWQEATGKPAEIVEFTQQVRILQQSRTSISLTSIEYCCSNWRAHYFSSGNAPSQRLRHVPPGRCVYTFILFVLDACSLILTCYRHHPICGWPGRRSDPCYSFSRPHCYRGLCRDCSEASQYYQDFCN
jgi:hypothetical protein